MLTYLRRILISNLYNVTISEMNVLQLYLRQMNYIISEQLVKSLLKYISSMCVFDVYFMILSVVYQSKILHSL